MCKSNIKPEIKNSDFYVHTSKYAPHARKWTVMINGKNSGVVETNYSYAALYWGKRASLRGFKIELSEIN